MRACHAVKVSFFADDPTLLTDVRWYFIPDSNADLPFATPFSDRNWNILEGIVPVLGERKENRTFVPGLPPYGVSFGGPCGTKDAWENGCLTTEPVPARWPGTDLLTCCPRPRLPIRGGEAYGARVTMNVAIGCCDDTPVLPTNLVARCVAVDPGCECWLGLTVNLVPYFGGGWISDPPGVFPPLCGIDTWNFFLSCSPFAGFGFGWGIFIQNSPFGFRPVQPATGSCDPFDIVSEVFPDPGTGCGAFAGGKLTWHITLT